MGISPLSPSISRVQVLSPCKINLCLYVLGKRPDGFHDLQSLFCLLNYGDIMTFTVIADGQQHIEIPQSLGINIEDNLIYKAVTLLQHEAGLHDSVKIEIDKKIPIGGGLGGGSSNAATTLLVLNALAKLKLTPEQLLSFGARLGSDVPFFVQGHNAFVEGRGERVHAMDFTKKYYLVVTPNFHVSTKEIFTDPRLPKYFSPRRDLATLFSTPFSNDCVTLVSQKFPEIRQILNILVKYGRSAMSGTGASCFCVFPHQEAAEQAQHEIQQHKLQGLNITSFVARSCNISPVLTCLQSLSY